MLAATVAVIVVAQTAGRALLERVLPAALATVGVVALQSALLVAVAFAATSDRPGLLRWRRPTRRDWLAVFGTLAAMGALVALLAGLNALGVPTGGNRVDAAARPGALASLLLAAVAVLGIGPGEELVFRGVVQGVLARAVSARAAVAWAAVCFGGLHALAVTGSSLGVLVYLAFASLLGAALGWSYEATGNLLVPVLAHGGYDAVQFLLQYAGLP